jgi:hypothetical protein
MRIDLGAHERVVRGRHLWKPAYAEGVARQPDATAVDETNAEDSVMWYPVLAMEIMKRANVVD